MRDGGGGGRAAVGDAARRGHATWIPASVIALLMSPLALTSRSFGPDWTLHLWAIRQQQLNIEVTGRPGLFLSARPLGVLYPMYAFVGSGMYALGGYLAVGLGDRPVLAYKLLFLAGLCLACGGMSWLGRQVGLEGWRSQVPGVVYVTGAYFVSDMLGRGDFAEFMAIAAIPFLLAAGRAALTARSLRAGHVLALVLATFVFTGTHNITLLWGGVFVVLVGFVVLFAFASDGLPAVPWRRVAGVIGGAAIGFGLNAWFLLADLAYGLDTAAAAKNAPGISKAARVQPGMLLNPLRTSPLENSPFNRDLRVALPWMFGLWAVVAAGLVWRRRDTAAKRLFAGVGALTAVYLGLILSAWPWRFMPHVLYNVQFRWRLQAYVLLATALLVMVVLTWPASGRRRAARGVTAALVVILVFNVGMATWQVWRVRSEYVENIAHGTHGRDVATGSGFLDAVVADRFVKPVSWYGLDDFRDFSAPVIATAPGRRVVIPETEVRGSHFSGVVAVPDGPDPFATNIAGGPRFVRMHGIRAIGRDSDGLVVAVRAPGTAERGPVLVTIEPAVTPLLRIGDLMSLASAIAVLGLLVWLLRSALRRGRGSRRLPPADAQNDGELRDTPRPEPVPVSA